MLVLRSFPLLSVTQGKRIDSAPSGIKEKASPFEAGFSVLEDQGSEIFLVYFRTPPGYPHQGYVFPVAPVKTGLTRPS
jgi:hypothetical protein